MSLRTRLIAIALVVVVGVIASVQIAWWFAQERWLRESLPRYHERISQTFLVHAYADALSDGVEVARQILAIGPDVFRNYFSDVLLANGPSPDIRGSVDLNPLGAAHRDPRTFPLDEIRAGIRDAMASRRAVLAGGGFCVPIQGGDRVLGGAWFQPNLPPLPRLPLSTYLVPILIGVLLFGGVAFLAIERSVVRPLRNLGTAAGEVGSGRVGVRVERLVGARELDRFVDAFNLMAERVEGHRSELEREVAIATATAERRQTALLRSARLASMGTLAAGIAHEINNPIGGMQNAVHRLSQSEGLTDRDRRYIELVQQGLERVSRIARRVLDFTPRQFEPLEFTVASAVEGARGLIDHRLKHDEVELRAELPADLPPLSGDPHEFQQVLLNLFINSLDVLADQDRAGRILVRGHHDEEWITIAVEDNGPGMKAADLPFVMDPFYSGKGRPDASGLGMFISHQIIENHGGSLEVESIEGQSFTVTIRLPRAHNGGMSTRSTGARP